MKGKLNLDRPLFKNVLSGTPNDIRAPGDPLGSGLNQAIKTYLQNMACIHEGVKIMHPEHSERDDREAKEFAN